MTQQNIKWFLFCEDKLLLKVVNDGCYQLPQGQMPPCDVDDSLMLTTIGGKTASLSSNSDTLQSLLSEGEFKLVALRSSYDLLNEADYILAGRAEELLYWDANSKFCPACGAATEKCAESAKRCPQCSKEIYPPISPAVVICITRGDEILLVRSKSIRHNILGLVAGFLEVGETLEECVEREIMEEVGLKVDNIRYFGSQPWPYPCGVMVGFTANYVSGDIVLQEEEIGSAAFFHKDNMPENIPPHLSIARQMIDKWLAAK